MIREKSDIYKLLENQCWIENFTSEDCSSSHRIKNHIAETFVKLGLAIVVLEDYRELQKEKDEHLHKKIKVFENEMLLLGNKYNKLKEDRDKLKRQKEKIIKQKNKLKEEVEKLKKKKIQ